MIDVETLRPVADEMLSGFHAGEDMQKRIVFIAGAAENLPDTANVMLHELHAASALRHRILVAAERKQRAVPTPGRPKTARPAYTRLTPAMGMALVLAIMVGLGFYYGGDNANKLPALWQVDSGMTPISAGSDPSLSDTGSTSIFVGEGANPPIVGINGRYYRMTSVRVPESMLGTAIAEVQSFTEEPSLLPTNVGVISNILPAGTQIYKISDLSDKTACIAQVDGTNYVFQRISYASTTLLGSEQLEDTLNIAGKVSKLTLTGVGTIDDPELANELIYTLLEFASEASVNEISGESVLRIELQNGVTLQLLVEDNLLGGCGVWACPEFFEAFTEMLYKTP